MIWKNDSHNVYVIPYNKEISCRWAYKISSKTRKRKSNLIDLLFSSLAETHKENVIELCYQEMLMMEPIGLK
jgi:hypothetical protein